MNTTPIPSSHLMNTHTHTSYLYLETENCDSNGDYCCNTQSEKHRFCVIVTTKQRASVNFGVNNLNVYVDSTHVFIYLAMDPVM